MLINQTWIIYKITNNINGKAYIGLTSRTLEERWYAHCSKANSTDTHFAKAIIKYGKNNWTLTELENSIKNKEDACLREIQAIAKYNTYKDGYNSTIGGEGVSGYTLTKEQQAKATKNWKQVMQTDKGIETLSKAATARNMTRYSTKKQWFYHPEYGTEFTYKTELAKKYGFKVHGLYLVEKGKNSHCHGWTIITPTK